MPGTPAAAATLGGILVLGYPANANGNSIYYYDLSGPGWSTQSGAGVSISTDSAHLYVIGSSGGTFSGTFSGDVLITPLELDTATGADPIGPTFVQSIPEPPTLAMFGIGWFFTMLLRRPLSRPRA